MAEVTARRAGELLRGVFTVLMTMPDGLPASEALQRTSVAVPPTACEAADYPNRPGVRRYEKLIRFHTIHAVKVGWLVKDAGRWALTDLGRQAYGRYPDPADLYHESVRLHEAWHRGQPEIVPEPVEEPGHTAGTLEEAEETAWAEIESYLMDMPPYDFQDLVSALLTAMGYHVAWVALPGADGSSEMLAFTDPLGASGPRIKVQVKRHSKITAEGLRSFFAGLDAHDVGILVSAGGFTAAAESEARRQEQHTVTLLDLLQLFRLWVEHYSAVPEAARKLLPLKPVYYLVPR